jgi:prepilin-type N-terminal cleavage/methylation domain-containing protein
MTQRQRNRGVRPAFTLIEILVVITIIAILVSLTTAAVMRAITKGPELQCSSEIGELQAKLANVIKNPANPLVFVPSRLHLSKKNIYTASQLDQDSIRFLQARFGKHTCCDFTPLPSANLLYSSVPFIDWNGDGNANEELYLEGQQCLVFHLGGVPVYNPANTVPAPNVTGAISMVGFSNNPLNPAAAPSGTGEKRQGPYFEFQSNRLVAVLSSSTAFPTNTGKFPVYLDPWMQTGGNANRRPFAFFASYNPEGGGQYSSDCPSLIAPTTGNPLQPYQASATTFVNPSNFQIISAGKDGKFGAGGTLWGRTGTTDPNGADDQSNFSAHLLGVAP